MPEPRPPPSLVTHSKAQRALRQPWCDLRGALVVAGLEIQACHAYAYEFIDDNEVKVNTHRFDNDLSGSRGELGVGVAVSMVERLQLHADFDYSRGEHIDQPWGVNLGLRYSW